MLKNQAKLRDLLEEKRKKEERKAQIKAAAIQHRDAQMLEADKSELEQLNSDLQLINNQIDEVQANLIPQNRDITAIINNTDNSIDAQRRAQDLRSTGKTSLEMNRRAITIGGGKLPTNVGVAAQVNESFNEISSIVDLVKITDSKKMGAKRVPYKKANGEGAVTAEGGDYHESDASFDYKELSPVKITILEKISEESRLLTDIDYFAEVTNAVKMGLRKKLVKLIFNGDPKATPKEIEGVLNGDSIAETKEIAEINEKTLREIMLAYGGDENVCGQAYLFLSKKDLIKFGEIRGSDKKAVYEIIPNSSNPNIGVIKEGGTACNYCISSALTALSDSATVAGKKTMVYGQPFNYELTVFGDMSIKILTERYAEKGLIGILGDIIVGGALCVDKGMIVVAKKASV